MTVLSNKIKGYLFAVVAAATYGMNPLFALPLYADGMDADSVLFFRYLFALCFKHEQPPLTAPVRAQEEGVVCYKILKKNALISRIPRF